MTDDTRISQKGSYLFFCLNINRRSCLRLHKKKTVNELIIGSDFKKESRILQQKFDFIEKLRYLLKHEITKENSSNYIYRMTITKLWRSLKFV